MADLIDRDALLKDMGLTDAVKYGNKDAEQQTRSYSTWMSYEIADAIADAPAVNRWISVEDDLPDEFIYVICGGKDGMAILRYNGQVWVDDAGCVYSMSAITHWMPLPEPPKE
jgi:hypothetical protein